MLDKQLMSKENYLASTKTSCNWDKLTFCFEENSRGSRAKQLKHVKWQYTHKILSETVPHILPSHISLMAENGINHLSKTTVKKQTRISFKLLYHFFLVLLFSPFQISTNKKVRRILTRNYKHLNQEVKDSKRMKKREIIKLPKIE